jgi:hypothetical protein
MKLKAKQDLYENYIKLSRYKDYIAKDIEFNNVENPLETYNNIYKYLYDYAKLKLIEDMVCNVREILECMRLNFINVSLYYLSKVGN